MFENRIRELNENYDLFYNSDGNPLAFKLCVKHLSFAKSLNYIELDFENRFKVLREFYLVDFEKEEIKKIKKDEIIELIELITYND